MKTFGTCPSRARVGEVSAQAGGVRRDGLAYLAGQLDRAEDADTLLLAQIYFGVSVSDSCAERATAAGVKGKTRGVAERQSES